MRGRSSRTGGSKIGMEIDEVDGKVKEAEAPPHLSGAYIRSLVKQLSSSSRTQNSCDDSDKDGYGFPPAHHKFSEEVLSDGVQVQQSLPPHQQLQHKKQVRRRLHTTRPYQERLLNMAEARREIVTALKFHRASMKQANEHQSPPPQPPQSLLQLPPPLQSEGKTKCRRNRRIYPSSSSSSCMDSNFSNVSSSYYYSTFGCSSSSSSSSFSSPNPHSWPTNSHEFAPSPAIRENFNLALPNQPLGLNLNIHDFSNLEAALYHNPPPPPPPPSSSSSSTPPSPIPKNPAATSQKQGTPTEMNSQPGNIENGGLGLLHLEIDEEEMAEMRWMGEQHQMEWNDTVNLVTSAWWFKYLKNSEEIGPTNKAEVEEEGEEDPFDQAQVEFPAWLIPNDESCFHRQHYFMNHHWLDDYSQDPALPCMDIGEIEGLDGEWFWSDND